MSTQIKRKSIQSLKRRQALKFRALRKGDELWSQHRIHHYLAVVDTATASVVAYVSVDGLFDEHGNYYKEA